MKERYHFSLIQAQHKAEANVYFYINIIKVSNHITVDDDRPLMRAHTHTPNKKSKQKKKVTAAKKKVETYVLCHFFVCGVSSSFCYQQYVVINIKEGKVDCIVKMNQSEKEKMRDLENRISFHTVLHRYTHVLTKKTTIKK